MVFDSLQAFIAMGGHGPFIWTCYAAFLIVMVGLVFWSFQQRRQVIAQSLRQQRIEQRKAASTPVSPSESELT
ncbi:MAG: heme exporter protein CcmD [Marinobacter sp.]|nr:heme exporter protein CcmD [Marinobacter sp.]